METIRFYGFAYLAAVDFGYAPFSFAQEYADQLFPSSFFWADICTFYGPWPQFNVRCALLGPLLLLSSMPFTFSLWANLILCFVWFSHIIKKFYCGNWTRCQRDLTPYRRKIEAPPVFLDIYVKDIVNVCWCAYM